MSDVMMSDNYIPLISAEGLWTILYQKRLFTSV